MIRFDAIIPMKSPRAGKSRLGGALTPEARERLVTPLLDNVIAAAEGAAAVGPVYVMTDDPAIAVLAAKAGAQALEEEARGLNAGLAAAARARAAADADALLILPGDLGWITARNIDRFLAPLSAGARGARTAALATDQHGNGTSALAWRPARAFCAPAFGADSAARHARLLTEAGFTLHATVRDPAFADIDTADDYRRWAAQDTPSTDWLAAS